MRCEIVAVGTEILLGQIVDTNSAWISERLAEAGIDCYLQTVVGDNSERMSKTFGDALERADALIVTGGLGPTQDDLTRQVVADLMGVQLERDLEIVERIRERFSNRGRSMPDNNLKQADIPVGALPIPEMPGTAAGLICPMEEGKVIYVVPGVPSEMKLMLEGTVIPDLVLRSGVTSVIRSRVLKTWGHSESGLAEDLAEEIERLDDDGELTLAFQASGIEGVKVRITAKATDREKSDLLLDSEEDILRGLIGDYIFAVDDATMESVILDLLRSQSLTFATAESLTGGMIGTRLTEVPGSSDSYIGSIVAYEGDLKNSLLDVSKDVPVVSQEAVEAMALGVCKLFGADVSVAATGVAGPSPHDGQEVGTVWMASNIGGQVESFKVVFPFDRTQVRQFTVITVLNALRKRLESLQ
ncbi:MAG: competence/damage-inducible protein A [Actinobacteria bacterium]|nr:competence/damage-inducible protein A [Actinomycetota bacterium]|tara:strand:+ start:13802 stop:15046 length:1245 start_codon:yes stop_codon:yes gene_type:complete